MASEKNLITQARLQEIKFAQNELVDNLYAHVNASLSKAHGIELYYLPHPTLDGAGNDISIYLDSHGDRVGFWYMRLTFNNTSYYAPLETTVLAGKDPMTGISPNLNVGVIVPVTPGGSAWVTDFTPEDEQDLIVTNDSVLYPHTLLAHWETHTAGVYQIIPQSTYDTAGHKIGTHVARIVVDGAEYWIPCVTTLGGLPQPPRVAFPSVNTGAGTNWNYCSMGADNNQYGQFYWNNPTGGTQPISFVFQRSTYIPQKGAWGQWQNDPNIGALGTWVDMPVVYTYTTVAGLGATAEYQYHAGFNHMTIRAHSGNDSQSCMALLRGKFTGAGGITYTNYVIFIANDEDGCGPIADPGVNQAAFHTTIANDPVWTDGYYYPPGPS